MRRISIGTMLAGALLVGMACKTDPTSDLRGGPVSLVVDPRVLYVSAGDVSQITVTAVDGQLNLVATDFAATSSAPTVATVTRDTVSANPDGTRGYFNVSGVATGTATIQVTGGGLSASATVNVP